MSGGAGSAITALRMFCERNLAVGGDRAAHEAARARDHCEMGHSSPHCHQDEFTGTVGKKGMSPGGGWGQGRVLQQGWRGWK